MTYCVECAAETDDLVGWVCRACDEAFQARMREAPPSPGCGVCGQRNGDNACEGCTLPELLALREVAEAARVVAGYRACVRLVDGKPCGRCRRCRLRAALDALPGARLPDHG